MKKRKTKEKNWIEYTKNKNGKSIGGKWKYWQEIAEGGRNGYKRNRSPHPTLIERYWKVIIKTKKWKWNYWREYPKISKNCNNNWKHQANPRK